MPVSYPIKDVKPSSIPKRRTYTVLIYDEEYDHRGKLKEEEDICRDFYCYLNGHKWDWNVARQQWDFVKAEPNKVWLPDETSGIGGSMEETVTPRKWLDDYFLHFSKVPPVPQLGEL